MFATGQCFKIRHTQVKILKTQFCLFPARGTAQFSVWGWTQLWPVQSWVSCVSDFYSTGKEHFDL